MHREYLAGHSGCLGPLQPALTETVCPKGELPDPILTVYLVIHSLLQAAEPQFRVFLGLSGPAGGDRPLVFCLLLRGESHLEQVVLWGAACGIWVGFLLLGDGEG